MQKIPTKKGKKVFSLVFLDPSSPRLAFGSPGPPNNFMVKKPTRLGEIIASVLSFSSPGRVPARLGELQLPQSDPLPINRFPRGFFFKGSKVHNRIAIVIVPTLFLVWCSSCNHRLIFFLRFEYDLCTLRGPPCYYVHIHILHLSSAI